MSNPFLGEIRLFAGNFNPRGWAFCNGALLSIAQNDALYALLGTTFGGDGQTTFGIPDLRGRLPVGQGQGSGLSNYVVGQMSGTETVTLTSNQMPSHSHTFFASTSAGSLDRPGATAQPAKAVQSVGGQSALLYVIPGAASPITPVNMNPANIASTGGSQPHENLMPLLTVNYIIALEGVFPSRN
ncbi:phage tail protein [Sphingomonas sp.]|jgi:microcystin-dependent protein|uniref:phage tail protein n=1 Tax=Sphingomonas sp. TaxID=28214 RepID=UPI002E345FB6|nr:tail fiber protein [Sphingomonas sp.]HEX4695940.1 tail fiber protein [Sphingomonas sp.]